MSRDLSLVPLDDFQARMTGTRAGGFTDLDRGTIVVLPSITFPSSELRKIIGVERYEERLLCLLMSLAAPDMSMIYITSAPIDDAVIDYYLGFLDDPVGARSRLELVTLDDPAPRALSEKLLERHDVLERIRARITDPERTYILPFNVTGAERGIAEALGVPLFGPHPDLVFWGSKSGGRHIARAAGVPVLEGSEDLFSLRDVDRALRRLARRTDHGAAAVIKLNNGFSGQGNAVVDLARLGRELTRSHVSFCASEESWPSFRSKVEAEGAIVEELLREPGLTSPSVQVRIGPDSGVEIISTHDQILGGRDDQVYLGCRFPARAEYRSVISDHARAVADALADRGVVGWFGVDFVVVPSAGGYDAYLSEINLRLGGTTHPFFMARMLTGGTYDEASGELVADGAGKTYVATDNLKSPAYIGLQPKQVLAALADAGVAYDRASKRGAAPHLLGALQHYGKLGILCIADDRAAADDLYARCVVVLERLRRDLAG